MYTYPGDLTQSHGFKPMLEFPTQTCYIPSTDFSLQLQTHIQNSLLYICAQISNRHHIQHIQNSTPDPSPWAHFFCSLLHLSEGQSHSSLLKNYSSQNTWTHSYLNHTPHINSIFNSYCLSCQPVSGTWQFMFSTAHHPHLIYQHLFLKYLQ